MYKKHKCIDCDITIYKIFKRCRDCYDSFRLNNKKIKLKNKCISCDNVISSNSNGRCINCSLKNRAGKNNPNWKGGDIVKKCSFCFSDIKLRSYRIKRAKNNFCNIKCFANWKIKAYSLDNNPNYIDGRSGFNYPLIFSKYLKNIIRQRDNYICQGCGLTEAEHLFKYKQKLHIHHIDYNKDNCEENNLITACLSCNSKANKNRVYWKNFYSSKILE